VKEILGAVAICFAAVRVSSRPLDNFRGSYRCWGYADVTLSTVIGYAGYVAALGKEGWILGTAAVPALIPLVVLIGRYCWECYQLRLLGERLAGVCPVRNLRPNTPFDQALSVSHRLIKLIL
jgi:hypothetical protein